jgi:TetR/AcrR family transcriptional regulator, cholesterol catabolism regulator
VARPPGHGPGYEARRQEIIDAAASLFADKGYTATGTAQLCEAVGLGKGALYHYIGSKENLLVEIQDRVLVPLLAKARIIMALSDEEPLVRLRLLSQALLEMIFARLDHIWVYEHDYRHVTGANRKRLVRQRREFEDLVRDLIREAMDDGALRNVDLRLAVLQFLNLHNHTYQWAHSAGAGWTPAKLAAEYCATMFLGLAAKPFSTAEFEEKVRLAHGRADQLVS